LPALKRATGVWVSLSGFSSQVVQIAPALAVGFSSYGKVDESAKSLRIGSDLDLAKLKKIGDQLWMKSKGADGFFISFGSFANLDNQMMVRVLIRPIEALET
jgi:hypothetical protein